jgi:predicted kinase
MPDELFQDLTGKGGSGLRDFSKELNQARMKGYMQGKLGMIIDGTGHNYSKIKTKKDILEKEGYDTYMVFVNTSLDVAQQRNKERDRVLPAKLVAKSWQDVQNNLGKFQALFGNKFVIVDNSKFLSAKDAASKFEALTKKFINKWASEPIKNPKGQQWVKDQLKLKKAGIK